MTTVWVEDALPAGAIAGGSEPFVWVAGNPAPYSGSLAHQSTIATGLHQHTFANATTTFAVGTGDRLFTYVYLDPANPPREVMLEFNDGTWEHRAYWGANLIPLPVKDGPAHRYMGPLPALGQWVRLEVAASLLGLEGRTLNGVSYVLYDGRATWDRTGKVAGLPSNQPPVVSFTIAPATAQVGATITMSATSSYDPDGTIATYAWAFGDGTTGTGATVTKSYATANTYPVTLTVTDSGGSAVATTRLLTISSAGTGGGGTTVWFDDALPAGAVAGGNEPFTWVTANPAPFAGTSAHQSTLTSGIHQHYFIGATATLAVNAGDTLYAHVYLDPANPPRQVMLQFFDGTWEHRAYWGTYLIPWGGTNVGPLPAPGQWVRLQVPASAVGLEGRTLSGMAFTLYDGRATWDQAGKTAAGADQPTR